MRKITSQQSSTHKLKSMHLTGSISRIFWDIKNFNTQNETQFTYPYPTQYIESAIRRTFNIEISVIYNQYCQQHIKNLLNSAVTYLTAILYQQLVHFDFENQMSYCSRFKIKTNINLHNTYSTKQRNLNTNSSISTTIKQYNFYILQASNFTSVHTTSMLYTFQNSYNLRGVCLSLFLSL